ncbi:MAG: hypothetical protein AAB955_02725, partial [Patescibacteria group bacterium]
IEGGVGHRQGATTERDSILQGGGMGLSEFNAEAAGIPVVTTEPPVTYERAELEKLFSREEIQYNYFVRQAYQWTQMLEPREPFDVYKRRFLHYEEERSGWADFDFSLEAMLKLHREMHGKELDLTDTDFLYDLNNPVDLKTKNSHVSRAESIIRDEYCADAIAGYIKKGTSVFVHFGGTHAVMQEPHLRELLA